MNRRQFISSSAVLLAAGSIAGEKMFASTATKPNRGRIGIQLYTVREELSKNFEGTLKKLSDTGYSSVELYGFDGEKFFNRTLVAVNTLVKGLGMSISGAHVNSRILPEDTAAPEWDFFRKCSAALKSCGTEWILQAGFPGARKTVDDLKRAAAHFNRVGEVCKKEGVRFGIHNGFVEMEKIDGEIILDFLIKNTDPRLVAFQLDMGHAVRGGGDCMRYLREFSGRFPLWHASDFDTSSQKYVDLGKGNVPYLSIFDQYASKLDMLTVDQEYSADILLSCTENFEYLRQFKWTKVR